MPTDNDLRDLRARSDALGEILDLVSDVFARLDRVAGTLGGELHPAALEARDDARQLGKRVRALYLFAGGDASRAEDAQ